MSKRSVNKACANKPILKARKGFTRRVRVNFWATKNYVPTKKDLIDESKGVIKCIREDLTELNKKLRMLEKGEYV